MRLYSGYFQQLFRGVYSTIYLADDCKLELAGNDQMQFDKKELKLPEACRSKEITLTLKHWEHYAFLVVNT